MARRQLLTDEQWSQLRAPPSDEREIVRYWTLSGDDFHIIVRKRSDHSRLGFALLLCELRYPGRVLGAEEVPPVALVSFVARQFGVSPAAFIRYSRRDQTRRQQLAELMERLSYRSFDRASFLHYLAWLTPIAQNVQRPDLLVEMLLEDLRRHRVLIPTRRMLELLLHQARSRAERLVYRALTNGLTDTQGDALDTSNFEVVVLLATCSKRLRSSQKCIAGAPCARPNGERRTASDAGGPAPGGAGRWDRL